MHELAGYILAHQGGWDEMLMVAAPLALIGGLLWMANKRAGQRQDERAEPTLTEPLDAQPGEDNLS